MHLTIRKKRLLLLPLLIILMTTLAVGCTKNDQQTENKNIKQLKDSAADKNMHVGVYYVKYTPDDTYLVREEHIIPQADDALRAALEELIKVKPETEGAVNILPPDTRILDITVQKGTAVVNFSREVLEANVGSEGEILGIQSIVNTLTEFPDVEKVSFQVEGSDEGRACDWWGHVGLYDQPFKRDVSAVFEPAIWVTHPQPNQIVGVPMLVKGSARVWEGNISVQVADSNNNILAQVHGKATKSAPERGNFEMSIPFEPPDKGKGYVHVFGRDPKNGTDLIKVSIPVNWP